MKKETGSELSEHLVKLQGFKSRSKRPKGWRAVVKEARGEVEVVKVPFDYTLSQDECKSSTKD